MICREQLSTFANTVSVSHWSRYPLRIHPNDLLGRVLGLKRWTDGILLNWEPLLVFTFRYVTTEKSIANICKSPTRLWHQPVLPQSHPVQTELTNSPSSASSTPARGVKKLNISTPLTPTLTEPSKDTTGRKQRLAIWLVQHGWLEGNKSDSELLVVTVKKLIACTLLVDLH